MLITRQTLEELVLEAAQAARPPERLTVSQSAEKYRFLNNPGSYVGPWLNDTTPYLIEPMDELTSLDFTGEVFVGPAQSGKTDMCLNWIAHSAKVDPADMMVVQTSGPTARDFSIRRIDRLHRHSPEIGRLVPHGQGDNVYDKIYKTGMLLTLSWPSVNELSGKPIPRLWLTDYDRMPEDVDGEGNAFDLARKRTTTFRSRGMTVAESSPGFVIDNPKWTRKTAHEAPPTKGVLALYNRGDRRRWYWDCVVCHTKFEPSFELLHYPDTADKVEAAENAVLKCPHCEAVYKHEPYEHPEHGMMPGKHQLNIGGRWIKEGMIWTRGGEIIGRATRSDIASFWLKGVAAAFSTWHTLVFNYLAALEEYDNSGSEEALKTTTNTDQGDPYLPRSLANDRVPEQIKARAREMGQYLVPEPVRFLIATVDVQKNRFVVQVHGIALNGDKYIVDRYEIRKSKRYDEDGERKWVNPGAYAEDWKLIVEEVMLKTYELGDESGRRMGVKFTLCDSGGKDGTTANAYKFVRWLRTGKDEIGEDGKAEEGTYSWEPNLAGRFMLLKGASTPGAPRATISYPDAQRKDRNAGARGEVPVLIINTNMLKDQVNHWLDRDEPGGRYIFPRWLPDTFYIELTVEVRDSRKGWQNPRGYRNESWDLLTYLEAALLTPNVAFEHLDREQPPSWAETWDENSLVFNPKLQEKPFQADTPKLASLADLAGSLA